ncbi:MAG: hypothetical protein IKG93_13405 [Clostridiales bacterium]|nr:hypothetical protein [Clostridiales bacterium]
MATRNKIKIQASILTALLSISLVGCSSDKKYDDLEKRVAYLESKLGVSSESTVLGSTNAPTATTTVQADTPFYYLDGMSAQDIINMYISFYETQPYQGETFEEYYKNFPVEPFITHDDYKSFFSPEPVLSQWVDMPGSGRFENELDRTHTVENITGTAVLSIEIPGSQVEMDGTIGFSGKQYSIDMRLYIRDYETASAVYDGLYKWFSEKTSYFSEMKDSRGAELWSATAYDYPTDEGVVAEMIAGRKDVLKMSKTLKTGLYVNNGYSVKVDGYILEISFLNKVKS